jgi:hypothetical protein
MNEALQSLVRDLFDAGIETRQRAVLALLYDRALTSGVGESWTRFYRALFSALRQLSLKASAPTGKSQFAIESLLSILEDDLGSMLFGAEATQRLRASLERSLYFPLPVRTGVVQLNQLPFDSAQILSWKSSI